MKCLFVYVIRIDRPEVKFIADTPGDYSGSQSFRWRFFINAWSWLRAPLWSDLSLSIEDSRPCLRACWFWSYVLDSFVLLMMKITKKFGCCSITYQHTAKLLTKFMSFHCLLPNFQPIIFASGSVNLVINIMRKKISSCRLRRLKLS